MKPYHCNVSGQNTHIISFPHPLEAAFAALKPFHPHFHYKLLLLLYFYIYRYAGYMYICASTTVWLSVLSGNLLF